jgi:adenosylhomocysteine nucleosidase
MGTSRSGLIVFIGAERREFDGLVAKTSGVAKINWPLDFVRTTIWNGEPALFVANGPGPKLAGEAVRVVTERRPVAALISIGFCGALDPELDLGDIFVANEVMAVGPALSPPGAIKPHKGGRLVSTDRVVVTPEEKAELRRAGGAAVDMEAGAVAQRARQNGIPFYCVRVVTDTAGERLPLDFNRMRCADGRFSRARILLAACRNPGVIFPELIRLNQRTKGASAALGDFIADCRF